MAGAKEMKNRNAGLLESLKTVGTKPANDTASTRTPEASSESAPETAPRTGVGQNTFWAEVYQKDILDAQARADAAEAELANLKATHASKDNLAEAHRKLAEAESVLATALESQPRRKARLDELHEVPGRRRKLTAEQYAQLRENLAHNPLVHPVVVRVRAAGGYEIISGGNRSAIYRELGNEEIDITIRDFSDDEADRVAFYSNLLQPDLTDYEKYHGFKQRMALKGFSQTQVAAEAGVSQPYVSALMAFDELPQEALAHIKDAPDKFGFNAITALVRATKLGHGAKVVEAIQKVVTGELNQAAAVRYARATDRKHKRPDPVTIKQGTRNYCKALRASETSIRLDFTDAAEAGTTFELITELLNQRAKQVKPMG